MALPRMVLAPAFDKVKDNAGVEVLVATEVVNKGERFPELKDVTEPPPEVEDNTPPLKASPDPIATRLNPPAPLP